MAYPNPAIQLNYNRYQQFGLVGQIANLDNNSFYFDVATTAVEIQPGYGVYIDTAAGATQGQWLLPAVGAEDLVTHIVSFDPSNLNTALTVPVGNANSEVIFPAGTLGVKGMANGSIWVEAGTALVTGQSLQFDATNNNYIANALTGNQLLIIALKDAAADEIIPVRISRVAA